MKNNDGKKVVGVYKADQKRCAWTRCQDLEKKQVQETLKLKDLLICFLSKFNESTPCFANPQTS